jgi:hypothetical protein
MNMKYLFCLLMTLLSSAAFSDETLDPGSLRCTIRDELLIRGFEVYLGGGLLSEYPSYHTVYRVKTWPECYQHAMQATKNHAAIQSFSTRIVGCGRASSCLEITGAGDTQGAFFVDWYVDDSTWTKWTDTSGQVSPFTDKFLGTPMPGDQRFHEDGTLFH